MLNCTVCPVLQLLSDDGRCLSCCGNETRHGDRAIPRECCNCSASSGGRAVVQLMSSRRRRRDSSHISPVFPDECILAVNFVFNPIEDLKAQGSAIKRFTTVCILLILSAGFGAFIFLSVRPRTLATAPKPRAGGYKKVDSNSQAPSKPDTSSSGDYRDPILGCEDAEEDVDIVYMSNDGTVYRKFNYGILIDEEDIELDYDDESYSYK